MFARLNGEVKLHARSYSKKGGLVNLSLKKSIFVWGPVIVVAGVIFIFSNMPPSDLPPVFLFSLPYADKVVHFIIYGALGLSVIRAFSHTTSLSWGYRYLFSVLICILYGLGDEFHQSFIPGRSVEIADMVSNGGGAIIFCMGYLLVYGFRRGKEQRKT